MAVPQHSFEPAGLSIATESFMLPMRTIHAIRVVDLITKETTTLRIEGLQPPAATTNSDAPESWGPNAEEIKVAPQRFAGRN
jgi:hypothetical protein